MKWRIAAFTLVWAYACSTIWLLITTPDYFPFLCLFPPGYFFVAGLFFALVHEVLASRWPRTWITAAVMALSLEAGVFLYGGHSSGLSLGYVFGIAVLCASLLTQSLARHTLLLAIGAVIGSMLVFGWIISPQLKDSDITQQAVSPDGAFQATIANEREYHHNSFHIAPRYGWNGAFGRKVVESGVLDEQDDYMEVRVERFFWHGSHTINLRGWFPKGLPPSNALLPIPIIPTEIQ